jgi:hypothetical protein
MNGIMGLNHGLTEDLGSKVFRSTYHSRFKSQTMDDYWSYSDPVVYAGNTVMNALSMIDIKHQQDQVLLQRALNEPVIGSPVMNSKSVIPFHQGSSPILIRRSLTPPLTIRRENLDLQAFAMANFQINKQEQENAASVLSNELNPIQDPSITEASQSLEAAAGIIIITLIR